MSTNQPGSSAGPLRTTLEIDRLFVQQIYVRTANNIPISTGYVLLADGQGGTKFGPAAIQADYFSLSSMISAGTASFTNTLSTNFKFNISQISSGFNTINSQLASTYGSLNDAQGFINQNIIDLSNLIINISTYSSFVQSANLPFSTLSSYIINISNTFTPNTITYQLYNQSLSSYFSTQSSFMSNFSSLTGATCNTFNVFSTFQQKLYTNNLSTISTSYRALITTTAGNYSTLSTTIGNQQASYNQSLSTGMSSYMLDYSTILGNQAYKLDLNQSTLTNTVSTLSTLFYSVATYSISSQIVFLNSTLNRSLYNNILSLSSQLSTINGSAIFALANSIDITSNISTQLTFLSTSITTNYSTLATELSITQTRGINSQLYYQFYQLGITQSSILANNTSSIQYLSTVIINSFSTANYRFSTLVNVNYSTLLGVGYSSITIGNTQVTQSTILLLQSTLFATNNSLIQSSNIQSTNLGNTLSTNYGRTISTNVATLKTITVGSQVIQSTFYEALSSFSSSVYPFILNMSNSLSTLTKTLTNEVSNWTLDTVSNDVTDQLNSVRNLLSSNLNNTVITNPVVVQLSNLALGIISTTFSTLSSYTHTFAGFSTANVFTNNITFNGPVKATQGVFTQFFQICNIISTYTYLYTGNTQIYEPNPYASQVLVQMWGAGGAAGTNTNGGGGAYVEGIITVDPTKIYTIKVGGGGILSTNISRPYNGGGNGISTLTGGGGGATQIYITNPDTSITNIAVAGSGGGGGYISTFADWNASEYTVEALVQFSLNNSLSSNQQLGYSTFGNFFVPSTLGSYIVYNFSTLSTAIQRPPNIFNYSTYSSFIVSPYQNYNLSSFSTATSISFRAFSTIRYTPYNLLNYSTFNMSTLSTVSYVQSTILLGGQTSISSLSTFIIFNLSSLSTAIYEPNTLNYSTFSSFVTSPYLVYNLSSYSTATSIFFNPFSTIRYSPSTLLNYSTFNMSTMSTNAYVISSIVSSASISNGTTIVPLLNSTIYLLCGSWGGAGGIQTGVSGQSPYSTIGTGDFSLAGSGGGQSVPVATSNIITRTKTVDHPVYSALIKQSTFITYVGDFIPQLMGYSPYLYSSLSTLLSTSSNNSSNYSFVSTNILQDTTFSNYYSTVQNNVNGSSTLSLFYTVRDLFSLQNTFQPKSLTNAGITTKVDYTTDKTPTAIYAADLTFTINQLGSPYGIAAHLIPFPFDKSDDLLYSTAKLYISSMLSTIQYTSSATISGLKYFNKEGSVCNYNGTYQTEGIYCNALDRYTYQYLSTLIDYDNLIYTPSTISTATIAGFSTTGWFLSSLTGRKNFNINTSTIISSLYKQIFGSVPYKDVPPSFAPYVYDAFFPIAANSTLTSLVQNGGFTINYNTNGDYFTKFFETSTLVQSSRKMYNIFISSAGANGASLINSLPITISSLTREPALQSTATTFNTNNLITYISNYFQSQDYATTQGFTINDITFLIRTVADFPTVKLYIQTISTIHYNDYIKPAADVTCNLVYYGKAGDILLGGDGSNISVDFTRGLGGGGGGSGYIGGAAGAFTTPLVGGQQIQSKYLIGGGGGGGGSSYIDQLSGTGNSLPGQTFNSGYSTHPLASILKSGKGGIDSNSFNNYLLPSTFSSITTTTSLKKGGDGLLILTEYVDPFRIVISSGSRYYVPLRIDAATNEVVVNKLVISSAQLVTMGPSNPSSFYLDFANYQQFYLTLKDHQVSSFHIIPLNTISSPTMNFQTGNIYLNISTFSTSAVLNFSSFKIENTWRQDQPGVLSSYGNRSTYLFEYSIFNSNIYLTTPRTW
jgi:hypothetical protein